MSPCTATNFGEKTHRRPRAKRVSLIASILLVEVLNISRGAKGSRLFFESIFISASNTICSGTPFLSQLLNFIVFK